MNALVSVIVPVYNVEKYLTKCIESILSQTFRGFELILVDDGSTDKSGLICDRYAQKDERIRCIHKQNGGLTSARLAGYRASTGAYICFIDSDDHVSTDYLNKLMTAMEENQVDVAMCSYYVEDAKHSTAVSLPYEPKVFTDPKEVEQLFVCAFLGMRIAGENVRGFVWNKMYRRALITEGCFLSEREYFLEDHLFNLRYFENVRSVCVLPDALYYYFQNTASLTTVYRNQKWEKYKKLFAFFMRYAEEHEIAFQDEDGMNWFRQRSFFDAIDNATRLKEKTAATKEIQTILQDEQAKSILQNCRLRNMVMTEKVAYIMLRLHMYSLLYCYRNWRRKKAFDSANQTGA